MENGKDDNGSNKMFKKENKKIKTISSMMKEEQIQSE